MKSQAEAYPAAQSPLIAEAAQAADEVYSPQARRSVIRTLRILLPFEPDEEAIVACVLSHVLTCEGWNMCLVEQRFGLHIRDVISGLHLLSHISPQTAHRSVEDTRVMLLSAAQDSRTLLLFLCERLAMLQEHDRLTAEHYRAAASDALNLYAPVAARLGIYTLKHALESAAFPVLYPTDAERIAEQMQRMRTQAGDVLEAVAGLLRDELRANSLNARVLTRMKQPYSVFQKMREKSLSFIGDIHDLYAIRLVLKTPAECYQALGILHRIGTPVGGRFKDYIAFAKPNGYQSLHTTLSRLPGAPVEQVMEVQIRTEEMHREAEFGIAAHWSYKQHGGSTVYAARQAQLHQLLLSQEVTEHPEGERLADHIFVLTPRGEVIELPEGATPLDFAFRVHTDLGLAFKAAKVNGGVVPIDHRLENGDTVEIVRGKLPHASPQWMHLLTMSSAKAKLRKYLHQSTGEVPSEKEPLETKALPQAHALPFVPPSQAPAAYEISLAENLVMPYQFARCCKADAQPGEEIVGIVTRRGRAMIHRQTCSVLRQANKERMLEAHWRKRAAEEKKARRKSKRVLAKAAKPKAER